MATTDVAYFKDKLRQLFTTAYLPEMGRKLTGWDYLPEYAKRYYESLPEDQQLKFREAVADLFLSGEPSWQFNLIDLCAMLGIQEVLPALEQLLDKERRQPRAEIESYRIAPEVLEATIRNLRTSPRQPPVK